MSGPVTGMEEAFTPPGLQLLIASVAGGPVVVGCPSTPLEHSWAASTYLGSVSRQPLLPPRSQSSFAYFPVGAAFWGGVGSWKGWGSWDEMYANTSLLCS